MAGLKHLPQKLWLRLLAALLVIATLGLATPKASAVDAIGRIRQIFGDGNQQGGATGRSRGGAIRDEYCIFSNAERDPVGRTAENLVALLPATNLGKTTEAYPTLWFYIPVGQDSDADHIQLDLLDGDTLDPVFAAPIRFEIPSAPGIVGVTLPENTPPLQTGKSYLWFLSVECSEADASRNPIVFGEIERVAASAELTQQLAAAPDNEDYDVYAEFGIIYEMLTSLIEHRSANLAVWQAVLEANELSEVSSEQISILVPDALNSRH